MDIAELGYKVDSTGLVAGTNALDQNAAAADKASGSADRLERYFQSMSRSIDRSAVALGDRLGGALERIGVGTGTVITELQAMNRAQAEIVSALAAMEGRLSGATSGLKAYSAAGKSAAADATASAAASEKLEQQLAQQEARYRSVAQQAMAYAEAGRTSNLSDRALAEAARDAAAGIDVKAAAMSRAGTEQERMVARARALQEAEARTANQARAAAEAAQAQEINLKRLLAQIDPTVAGLNRLAEMEERLERAGDLGLIKPQVMQQYQAQIEASRQALLKSKNTTEQYGMTARQTAAAMRMIPAQMTDIVTSVVAGQPIWMVAIQQGGQLKDQLGGIGPAAKAVSSYVLGMVNPMTLSAAAAVALAVALKQSQDELFDFQKNLILTGRNADISGGQFRGLVSDLDKLAGVTRGGAVDALTAVAASGQFAGKQFLMVAEAAARMESSTGQASSKTVEAFQRIARDPVDALVELNRQEGFLTAAQLLRIRTLQEEGHEQQAVAEALQIYYERSINVANQAEAAMPSLVKWWRDVKDEVGGAWGEVMTFSTELERLGGKLKNLLPASGLQFDMIATLASPKAQMQRLNSLIGGSRMPTPVFEVEVNGGKAIEDLAKVYKEQDVAAKAASEALTTRLAGLDRESAKLAARNKIIELYNKLEGARDAKGNPDSRLSDGSMQRLIAQSNAQIDKQFNQREGVGRKDTSFATLINQINQQTAAIDAQALSTDKLTAAEKFAERTRAGDTYQKATRAEKDLVDAKLAHLVTQEKINDESLRTQRELAAQAALTERLKQLEKQRQEQSNVDLMGIGRGADATQMLQRQLEIQREYLREREKLEKAQLDKNTALSPGAYNAQVAELEGSLSRSLDIERDYQQQRMDLLGDWRTGFTRVWDDYVFAAANASEQAGSLLVNGLSAGEDAFVRLAQTGKLSFSSLIDSMIADLARYAFKQQAVGLIGAFMGGGVGAAGSAAVTGGTQSITSSLGESLVGGVSFGGGRANGGPVAPGSLYEVGEGGDPELFQQGGRSYLIPGNRGQVVPAAPMASGGGSYAAPETKIEINNYGGGQVQTREQRTTMPDGRELRKLVVDIIADDMGSGGRTAGAAKSRFGLREQR
ncbi:phage tail length tape measure family protein [Xanthomonas arboricola]|uniref:phage tail length tape measure family protein n=1 Tax=Xanthomonas arboricola TaxID=56448 RepID=UPI002B2A4FB1|nr:phage tail length tape measure family protein [Xanthomonas arboricola]